MINTRERSFLGGVCTAGQRSGVTATTFEHRALERRGARRNVSPGAVMDLPAGASGWDTPLGCAAGGQSLGSFTDGRVS